MSGAENGGGAAPVGSGRHIVRAGQDIGSIAHRNGFFWETVWQHPDNAELRRVRSVLLPMVGRTLNRSNLSNYRLANCQGLVLGCIEADFCKSSSLEKGKLLTRAIRFRFLHISGLNNSAIFVTNFIRSRK